MHKRLALLPLIVCSFWAVSCGATPESVEVTRVVEIETEVTRIVEVSVEVTRVVEIPVEVTRVVQLVITEEIVSSATPSATDALQEGGRQNPYPVGQFASFTSEDGPQYEFAVVEVIKGEEALGTVMDTQASNDMPPPDHEYVLIKVAANFIGDHPGILKLSQYDIELVSQNNIYEYFDVDAAYGLTPRFDFEMLSGASAEGWLAWPVPTDDEMLLKLGDAYFELLPTSELTSSVDLSEVEDTSEMILASELDLEDFTDTWIYEAGDVTLVYTFFEDGVYIHQILAEVTQPGFEPHLIEVATEGTWEFQGGHTICLIPDSDVPVCQEWFINGDTLARDVDTLRGFARKIQ